MKINTLVKHKIYDYGVGCTISEKLKDYKITVRFKNNREIICKISMLKELIPTGGEVSYSDYKRRVLTNKGPKLCILGNELMEFVGVGWVAIREINQSDIDNYPRVVFN